MPLSHNKSHEKINFNNPVIKSPLLLTKTSPIYPNNEDVFIQFEGKSDMSILHGPLEGYKVRKSTYDNVENDCLTIIKNGEPVISIYSELNMLYFLEFLFSNLKGAPIGKILQSVSVPSLDNLNTIIQNFHTTNETFHELSEQLARLIDTLITKAILR